MLSSSPNVCDCYLFNNFLYAFWDTDQDITSWKLRVQILTMSWRGLFNDSSAQREGKAGKLKAQEKLLKFILKIIYQPLLFFIISTI